jgi:nitrite reductase (NADH) small subunit
MPEFVRICAASEMPALGEAAEFTVQGRALCVAHVEGTIAVLDGVCPHEGGPLGEGIIENGHVVCPWHAYTFDVKTGATAQDPDLKVEVLEAKVEEGQLFVKL